MATAAGSIWGSRRRRGPGSSLTPPGFGVVPTVVWWLPRRSGNTTRFGKTQVGIAIPVFDLGEGGWALLDDDGVPGGFGLSEPIPGSPVGLQLAGDVPVVVSTSSDGGVVLRVFPPSDGARTAPVLGNLGAGTLLLAADGTPLVGAVMPLDHGPGPQRDGGQVRFLHFTGAPGSATPSSVP